jgi:hypothetical protein
MNRPTQLLLDISEIELIAGRGSAGVCQDDRVDDCRRTPTPPRGLLFSHVWMTCSPSDDQSEARAYFARRFERESEFVFVQDCLLWLGPL